MNQIKLLTVVAIMSLFVYHSLSAVALAAPSVHNNAEQDAAADTLANLTNLQRNNAYLLSSGLPSAQQLKALKEEGVTHVVDLIPGNRVDEILATAQSHPFLLTPPENGSALYFLSLNYNVPVDWEAPTLANFLNYAAFMKRVDATDEKVLTHCKLNWRGASFTYLYRVAVLGESEEKAKQDLMVIWHPNPTWHAFMSDIVAHYNALNETTVSMSFAPAPLES